MEHELKTIPPYYDQVRLGFKHFDIRKDDRDYQIGDTLCLKEYLPNLSIFTGNSIKRKVTHVLRNAPEYGLMPGYCIMSLESMPY
jgi:hypothetical protein